MSRSRTYCFTINNYTEVDDVALRQLADTCQYICWAPEIGESGTPHYQGFVRFKSAKSLTAAKALISNRAHLEVTRGTDQEARDYCAGPYSKEGKEKPANPEFIEFGEMSKQGKRTDLEEVRDMVNEGASMIEIIGKARSLQSIKTAQVILPYLERRRCWKTKVIWLWGPTGTGKSATAWKEGGAEAYSPLSYKWWQGYDNQETVILDDIRPGWATFDELLRLFDRYPLMVECKGGSRQFTGRTIYVTCPYDPPAFFQGVASEALDQMTRRIEEVRHLNTPYVFE